MFRKIVSNLNFSPALVGHLGFYARRLRQEEATRRIGLVFTALALVVQSLAIFSPPEAANAATPGQVGSAPRCNVSAVGPRDRAFTVTANRKAVVGFDVTGGKKCKVELSVNSFFAPSMAGTPYSQQVLHDRKTKVFDTPGRYSLQADLPDKGSQAKGCFYQVDLTYGTYNSQPVLAYDHGALDCGGSFASVTCTNLKVIQASATAFTLKGSATATNATIQKYVFSISQPGGQTTEKVKTTNATSASVDFAGHWPGTYTAKLTVHSTIGQSSGPDCKASFSVPGPSKPTALCNGVTATITNRTQAYFTGNATASGGATIASYTFIVKNAAGAEVKRIVVPSTVSTAATSAVDIATAGKYTVQLVVQTSLGDRTNGDTCTKPFHVAPPDQCQYNPALPPDSPDCQPCPDNPDLWVKDKKCAAVLINSKTATNMTQGNVKASTVTARANDKLTYTITVENTGRIGQNVTMQEDLSDVLEYASLIDQGGASFDKASRLLSWPSVQLAAGTKQSRTFAVQIFRNIPLTNTGTGVKTSYDCKLANTFGNTITINVDCPPSKVVVEQVTKELPHTGPRENMIFAGLLLAVVVYFYTRSRQLGKEVRLIRRNLNTATI
jgi:uncharacterized repeat protein (TIGR01451 family)